MRLFKRTEPLTAAELRLMAKVCDEFERVFPALAISDNPVRFSLVASEWIAATVHANEGYPIMSGYGSSRCSALTMLIEALRHQPAPDHGKDKPTAKGAK